MQLPVFLVVGNFDAEFVAEAYPSRAAAEAGALALCRSVLCAMPGPPPACLNEALSALAAIGCDARLTVVERGLDYAAGLHAAQAKQMANGVCDFAFAYCDAAEMATLIAEDGGAVPLEKYAKALRAWMRLESASLIEALNDVIGASLPTVRALNGLLTLDSNDRPKGSAPGQPEMEQGDL